MLMMPPAPPNPSMMQEKVTASMIGLFQGSVRTHPNAPLPPRKRLAISTDAQIVKTVSSVGSATSAVKKEWMNLKPAPTLRILEGVMHADRHRHHEEEDEGEAPSY